MKKQQLFGILALMMALGMSFPANTFAAHESAAETGPLPTQVREDEEEDEEKDKDKNKDKYRDRDQHQQRNAVVVGGNIDDAGAGVDDTDILAENDALVEDGTLPMDDEINPGMVSSYADLITVLDDPTFANIDTIRLVNDIIVDGDIQIARELPITLNLNGHSIISCGNGMVGQENARVIDVEHGEIAIIGEGSIMAMGPGGIAISVKGSINQSTANYAKVIIGEQVRLHAPNSYGIAIGQGSSAAYGVSIDLYGNISAQDGIYVAGSVRGAGDNAPEIQLADTSVVNAEDTGIVAAGFANWRCGASTISSSTGVKAYAGNLTFAGTNVLAGGEDLSGDGAGAAFLFGGESPENVNVVIDGGVYTSSKEYVFADYGSLSALGTNLESLEIKDGQFTSPVGIFYGFDIPAEYPDDGELVPGVMIRGGNFNADVDEFLASGIHLEETDDGRWIAVDEAALQLIEAKAELQAIVDLARAKEKTYYTAESYQKLVSTLTDTTQLLSQNNLTLSQIDAASIELNKALDALGLADNAELNEIVAARQELTEAISAARRLDPDKYNSDDYHDFMELIAEAEILLAEENASANDLQSMLGEIDAMREILLIFDEEQAFTTAKLALEELVDEVNAALSEVDPSDTVYDELRTTLVEAASLLANNAAGVSSDELEDAYSHINALKEAFFPATLVEFAQTADSDLEDFENPDLEDSDQIMGSNQTTVLASSAENPAYFETLDHSENQPENQPEKRPENQPEKRPENQPMEQPEDQPETPASTTDKTLGELHHGLAEMLSAVADLTLGDYRSEFTSQYYDLQTAITEAKELLANEATANAATLAEIMNKILVATSGLRDINEPDNSVLAIPTQSPQPVQPLPHIQSSAPAQLVTPEPEVSALDTSILSEIIAQIARLDSNKYTAASYSQILTILGQAKTVLANPASRQADIDQIVLGLYRATTNLVPNSPASASVSTSTYSYSSASAGRSSANFDNVPAASSISATSSASLPTAGGDAVTPSLMMSALAGIYTGLAMYRKSRVAAKNAKLARRRTRQHI